ncbi:MAG: metallophosphoesterase [Syntrophaceae bacterium]|nr:metallophosphoesterase [Syntrophaceae bacterium]
MVPSLTFGTLRFIVVSLAIFAQMYLFLRLRTAIRSMERSERFKRLAVCLAGAGIGLLFAMNVFILVRPIPWFDAPAPVQALLFYLPAVWVFGSILSALLLAFSQAAWGLGQAVARRFKSDAPGPRQAPADPGRRLFLQAGAGAVAAAPLILSGYGAAWAGRNHEVRELTLPFGLPLRVVQLTDHHAGPYMTREDLRRYADAVIALEPDLFVLTGDYVSNSIAFLPGCLEEMARVRARYGTFATLGNHEHWVANPDRLRAVFRQYGVPLLNNGHRVIRTAKGPFAVAGIDDMRFGNHDLDAALRGLDPSIPTILLSHRPEIFPEAAGQGIALTLAGHYHGGQITLRLPGGGLSLAHLRTPWPEGLFRIDSSHLYVSRGIGTTFTPVRLGARPEIAVLHLT